MPFSSSGIITVITVEKGVQNFWKIVGRNESWRVRERTWNSKKIMNKNKVEGSSRSWNKKKEEG